MARYYTYQQRLVPLRGTTDTSPTLDLDRGICRTVIIEAQTAQQANERAESIGMYFDGVRDGIDCNCGNCSDRWMRLSLVDPGYSKPSDLYGDPIAYDVPEFLDTVPRAIIHFLSGDKLVLR